MKIHPIILSGGSGTRLWPASMKNMPKQFMNILNNSSTMIEETILRCKNPIFASPVIVSMFDHFFHVQEALTNADSSADKVLLEPIARNTAAAIALASLHALDEDEDRVLIILPADHIIHDVERFHQAIEKITPSVLKGKIATLGIEAVSAETGYGYIEAGSPYDEVSFQIKKFHEKPDQKTAARYIDAENFYWNSGIFIFKASVMRDCYMKYAPDIWQATALAYQTSIKDEDKIKPSKDAYQAIAKEAFDKAIMEKISSGIVLPVDMGWSDLGSWQSIWKSFNKDEKQNLLSGHCYTKDTHGSLIWNEGTGVIAAIGLDDVVIIHKENNVLVLPMKQSEQVKDIVTHFEKQIFPNHLESKKDYRPWGYYTIIDQGENYTTKRIVVKPGGVLSLQYHHHRSENWVVVSGKAHVLLNGDEFELEETESTYIPKEAVHRLENKTNEDLIIIEVQSGDILAESDIVRLEDYYGRKGGI